MLIDEEDCDVLALSELLECSLNGRYLCLCDSWSVSVVLAIILQLTGVNDQEILLLVLDMSNAREQQACY